jgi:hypothetical protein
LSKRAFSTMVPVLASTALSMNSSAPVSGAA